MNKRSAIFFFFSLSLSSHATDYFVATNGADAAPYTNWATAAREIQSAANRAGNGDTVWVGDGVYDRGGAVVSAGLTNRVAMTNAFTLRSLNGAAKTFIVGAGPRGAGAVRGVYLGNNAKLIGFTVTNGHSGTNADWYSYTGGGIYAYGTGCLVSNCTVTGCRADYAGGIYNGTIADCLITDNIASNANSWGDGGGVYNGTLMNCTLSGNRAFYGGGAASVGQIANCTISSNSAFNGGGGISSSKAGHSFIRFNAAPLGGGAYSGTLTNCLVARNQASNQGGGAYGAALINCTVVSNSAGSTGGGISGGAATNSILYFNTATFDANYFNAGPSSTIVFCCTQPSSGGAGTITNNPQFLNPGAEDYHLSSNSPCIDAGTNNTILVDLDGVQRIQPGTGVVFVIDIGAYEYSVWHPTHYVAVGGAHVFPYDDWSRAATGIEAAVYASIPGDTILVSNAVFNAGGTVVDGSMTNRVVVSKAVRVQSVNGTTNAVVVGAGPLGDGAVRGVYLASGAQLVGFTVSNGFTRTGGTWDKEQVGGGIYCAGAAVISNCVIAGCSANNSGGGLYGGNAYASVFTNNSAFISGGGVRSAKIWKSLLAGNQAVDNGGGAYGSILTDCDIIGNVASNGSGGGSGAGAYDSTLNDSRLYANYAHNSGGGASGGSLTNCTVAWNKARQSGGGINGSSIFDCTIISNTAEASGGGMANGTARDSDIAFNISSAGGGMFYGSAINCAITGNQSTNSWGGGAYETALSGCIISSNQSATLAGGGLYGGNAVNCTFTSNRAENGGGLAFCTSCVNSVIISNYAVSSGGGAYYTTLRNCTIFTNEAHGGTYDDGGGGSYGGVASDCLFSNNWSDGAGGGSLNTVVSNSVITENFTRLTGAGASKCTLINCLIYRNYSQNDGGGLYNSTAFFCTIVSNMAGWMGGGTAYRMNATNCVIHYNRAVKSDDNNSPFESFYDYCGTTPNPGGAHNITAPPQFLDLAGGNYRLGYGSPCIDAGTNLAMGVTNDLDGASRPVDGDFTGPAEADMGAYEYNPQTYDTDGDQMTDGWERQYGLSPTNGADAAAHSDGDGVVNLQEFVADTDPTNAASCFLITSLAVLSSNTLSFASSSNRSYLLLFRTNLLEGDWTVVPGQAWVSGKGGPDSIADTNTASAQRFYKLSVRP